MHRNKIVSEDYMHRPLRDANAIHKALNYLQGEAQAAGLSFAAHLIGVASMAIGDSIEMANHLAHTERTNGIGEPKDNGQAH